MAKSEWCTPGFPETCVWYKFDEYAWFSPRKICYEFQKQLCKVHGCASLALVRFRRLDSSRGCKRRVRRIVEGKGHTGAAVAVDNTDAASSRGSRWRGEPGFTYQRDIYECSLCEHPINDGSDRLYTKSRDAPPGAYRFSCGKCPGFHMCEACWDRCVGSVHPPLR